MENMSGSPTAEQAAAALSEAEASRARLAGRIALPSLFFTSMAVAITVQIATTALGVSDQTWRRLLPLAGVMVLAAVAGVQMARFRRLNGVWLGGLASRVVLGTGTAASLSYAAALGIAIWSALDGQWALMVLSAIAGGGAYALSGRRWLRTYRREPALHGRGESAVYLAAVALLAIAGLALLMLER